jgi:hypothetical protein
LDLLTRYIADSSGGQVKSPVQGRIRDTRNANPG